MKEMDTFSNLLFATLGTLIILTIAGVIAILVINNQKVKVLEKTLDTLTECNCSIKKDSKDD
jgi:hypothetical protein